MKSIFIIGGTGSLGNTLVTRFISDYNIIIYSRDENKQWIMKNKYNSDKLDFIIGDISDKERLRTSFIKYNPNYIIIAAALKHIDICEYNTYESIKTNIIGIQNIINCISTSVISNLETTLFVSTDKACSPSNVYGMCKALSERIVIEKSLEDKSKKFVVVRYGNVLNSRGSLLPKFHDIGKDENKKEFTVTHKDMTRFFMTLNQSVDLITYALFSGKTGCTYIPKIISYSIEDISKIFSEIYNKPIVYIGIRPGEKMHETLVNNMELQRTEDIGDIYVINPPYKLEEHSNHVFSEYNSLITLSKDMIRLKNIITTTN